jgi:hypothetical protein
LHTLHCVAAGTVPVLLTIESSATGIVIIVRKNDICLVRIPTVPCGAGHVTCIIVTQTVRSVAFSIAHMSN